MKIMAFLLLYVATCAAAAAFVNAFMPMATAMLHLG